jgi:hypothetical protein
LGGIASGRSGSLCSSSSPSLGFQDQLEQVEFYHYRRDPFSS